MKKVERKNINMGGWRTMDNRSRDFLYFIDAVSGSHPRRDTPYLGAHRVVFYRSRRAYTETG